VAQTGSTPPRIPNNNYAIEIFQGPLLAPIRVTGVGGAYVADAENTEGSAVNPASPAVRNPYSADWFEYDLALGASLPGAFTSTDFDNHGDSFNLPNPQAGNFVDLTLGGSLKFGALGFAVTGDLEQYSLTTSGGSGGPIPSGAQGLTLEIGRWKVQGAYALFDGQLVLGGGARILTMQVHDAESNSQPTEAGTSLVQRGTTLLTTPTSLLVQRGATLLTMTGLGPEVGALYMPTGAQVRLGAAVRAPVSGGIFGSENVTTNAIGVQRAGPFVLPSSVEMPWEVDLGVAYQLGPRPLNPGWRNPHEQAASLREQIAFARETRAKQRELELEALSGWARAAREAQLDADEAAARADEDARLDDVMKHLHDEAQARYDNWPREKILVLASVLLTGPSSNAVSVEGFLDQRVETAGRVVTATPRVGLEGEPLRDEMQLRLGSYVEPSRYETGTPRQHFTFGGDIRLIPCTFWGLFPKDPWKIGFIIDLAPRYENYGLAIGTWH
jgi:hypothetical protein